MALHLLTLDCSASGTVVTCRCGKLRTWCQDPDKAAAVADEHRRKCHPDAHRDMIKKRRRRAREAAKA